MKSTLRMALTTLSPDYQRANARRGADGRASLAFFRIESK